MAIRRYFDIRELVCPDVYNLFGESSWQFLDNKLLSTLLFIRERLGRPIYVNTWHNGGRFTQRGLRCNLCPLVLEKTFAKKVYMSAHIQGAGVDFDVQGMTAEEVRRWIFSNKSLIPYPIRLERDVSWVHLDMRNSEVHNNVVFFKG